MSQEEAAALGVSYAQALSHLPRSKRLALYVDLGTAFAVTSTIVGLRVADDYAIAKSARAAAQAPHQSEDQRQSMFLRQNGYGENNANPADIING